MDRKTLTIFISIGLALFPLQAGAEDIKSPTDKDAVSFPFYVVTKDNSPANQLRLSKSGIPLPPHRPKVLNVSPSYLEELQKQGNAQAYSGKPQVKEKISSSLLPMPDEFEDMGKDSITMAALSIPVPPELPDVRKSEVLQETAASDEIPPGDDLAIKLMRPNRIEILQAIDPDAIEPAAGSMISEKDDALDNATIISFMLKPEQIALDDNIKAFLKEHALRLFQDNRSLNMEIQSYATSIENEKYSNIRISLARALEIRRFLIDKGVSPARLKLKPMAEKDEISQDDRIDLVLIK